MATYNYLSAGTRIVVEDSTGKAQWHNTKNELNVDGAENIRCPLTGEDRKCLVSMGFKVYFREDQIKVRDTEAEQYIATRRPCLLIYDIPATSDIYNPSAELRRYAIRVNLSCWIIAEGDIPMRLMNDLVEAGATWHVIRFDPSEAAKLVSMAILAIRKELDDMIVRNSRATESAINRLETVQDENPETTQKKYEKHTKLIQGRMETLLRDMENIVSRFQINPDAVNLSNARIAVEGLDNTIRARMEIFQTAVIKAREMGRDGNDIADAMERGEMPAMIAADFLDERDEGSGESLRNAFSDL